MCDESIITKLQKGDKYTYFSIFNMYKNDMLNVALKYTKNQIDAEDVCQETWIKIYQNIDTLEDETKLKAWILTIVKNQCLNHIRKLKKCDETLVDEFHTNNAIQETVLSQLYEKDIHILLLKAIQNLPVGLQELAIKFIIEEKTIQEISQELNINYYTCKTKLHRIKHYLYKKIGLFDKLNIKIKLKINGK